METRIRAVQRGGGAVTNCKEAKTTTAQIIEIKKRKGTALTIDFIKQFAKEWDAVVTSVKKSGADLSRIFLTEEPNS